MEIPIKSNPCRLKLINRIYFYIFIAKHVASIEFDFNALKNLIGFSICKAHLIEHGTSRFRYCEFESKSY